MRTPQTDGLVAGHKRIPVFWPYSRVDRQLDRLVFCFSTPQLGGVFVCVFSQCLCWSVPVCVCVYVRVGSCVLYQSTSFIRSPPFPVRMCMRCGPSVCVCPISVCFSIEIFQYLALNL